jgi:uncharacterized protein involved in exopolysaccharide biosynthesis
MNQASMQPQHTGDPEFSALEVAAILLRGRRWTLWLPFVLAVLTGLIVLVLPRYYTSSASFIPQRSQQALGRLAGIAAQFGVDVPGQNPGESQEFYADLVVSREILARIVADSFARSPGASPASLIDLLGRSGRTEEAALQEAVRRLRRSISVGSDTKTSIVTVEVATKWPLVSAAILDRLIAEVNEFDLHTRQTQAVAERAFVEERLRAAKDELRGAEDRLQSFLAGNREYRNSPALQFQYDRLYREVTTQQQIVTTLQQSFEQARIDEVRNTPRITVIERPLVPARPDSRHLLLRVFLTGLVCVVITWPVVLVAEGLRRAGKERRADMDAVLEQLSKLVPAKWRSGTES